MYNLSSGTIVVVLNVLVTSITPTERFHEAVRSSLGQTGHSPITGTKEAPNLEPYIW